MKNQKIPICKVHNGVFWLIPINTHYSSRSLLHYQAILFSLRGIKTVFPLIFQSKVFFFHIYFILLFFSKTAFALNKQETWKDRRANHALLMGAFLFYLFVYILMRPKESEWSDTQIITERQITASQYVQFRERYKGQVARL